MSHFLRVSEATVKSVNEVNSKGENRVCDSGCRGFEPRFSPHFLLGFQLNIQLKKKSKSPFACTLIVTQTKSYLGIVVL